MLIFVGQAEVSKPKPVAPEPARRESLTEEEKIMNMMNKSTQDFDPSTYAASSKNILFR